MSQTFSLKQYMLICNSDIILPQGCVSIISLALFLSLPFLAVVMLPPINLWYMVLTHLSFLHDQFSPLEPYM